MPRIPTLNRMYIAPARDYNAGGTARVISQAMGIAGQIAGTINNIQDTANIQSSLTEAKNNFNNTFNEYKIKYADNPQEFNKQITNYRNNLIQDTVKNSNVSLANKNGLLLDNKNNPAIHDIVKKNTMLVLNNLGFEPTEKDLASPGEYIRNSTYELSYRRILSKITIPIDNQTPFGDLKNITPVKKTKDTGIFVRNKKINNK